MAYIYEIKNKINNKVYIGSSLDLESRWYIHTYELNKNIHHNKYLQNSWNKYGEHSFEFNKLATISDNFKYELEQWYLDNIKPFPPNGYNISKIANGGSGSRDYSNVTGENSSLAKINSKQALKVKEMLSNGKNEKEVAEELNISIKIIKNIKYFKSWKNIGEEYNVILEGLINKNRKIIPLSDREHIVIYNLVKKYKFSHDSITDLFNINRSVVSKAIKKQDAIIKNKIFLCEICGEETIKNSNHQKYCKKCAKNKQK